MPLFTKVAKDPDLRIPRQLKSGTLVLTQYRRLQTLGASLNKHIENNNDRFRLHTMGQQWQACVNNMDPIRHQISDDMQQFFTNPFEPTLKFAIMLAKASKQFDQQKQSLMEQQLQQRQQIFQQSILDSQHQRKAYKLVKRPVHPSSHRIATR